MKKTFALAIVTPIAIFLALSPSWGAPKAQNKNADDAPVDNTSPATANDDVTTPAAGANAMLGTYVGDFGPHRITVCLQNLIGRTINGYSVVAGNERAFSGSLSSDVPGLQLRAREPGDNPEDGVFTFDYQPETKHLTGAWKPNNKKLANRTFDLARRDFRYDPKLGKYPQSSTRTLKSADVENIAAEELRIMRNEIYARHGYTFRMKDMRDHFDKQDWYMPISMNVSMVLTPLEEKNAQLIKKYENYGRDYYDAFGR